jgi:pimeloyl-ACP methyl ester carboxylesterase
MSYASVTGGAVAMAVGLLLPSAASAVDWPDDCQESTLPSDDPDYPDDQLILTCLPADFNGTLIIYAHGYVRPQQPLALPEELAESDVQQLVERLLDLGFGVATSSYHKNGYAVEQAEADLNHLVDYVKSSEPDVDAVYLAGASEGGLIATMLIEKYPETYAGALALCGPLAGTDYQIGYLADVRVLFDYFYPGVFPFGTLDVPDDAFEQWDVPDGFKDEIGAAVEDDPDAIGQVFNIAGVTCDTAAPDVAANCTQNILAYSVFGTNDLLDTAGGWPVSNVERAYTGSEDDAALNAGVERFDADPVASEYARLFYRPSGLLERPLVTLHTTGDPGVPYRHELIYFSRAALLGTDDQLTVLPVERDGHCAFTAEEVLGGFGALLLKADSDLVLALVDPLDALHDIIDVDVDLDAGADRVADMVQDQASDFVDELEDEFGFIDDVPDAAADAIDTVEDLGDDTKDAIDAVEDLGDDAKDAIDDLF